MTRSLLAALALVLACSTAAAHSYKLGALEIDSEIILIGLQLFGARRHFGRMVNWRG